MKALTVIPQRPCSAQLMDIPKPEINQVPNGRGVLIKVFYVGLCGTDKEIYLGEFGAAPYGLNYLVIGHEVVGKVIEIGYNVTDVSVGDYVSVMVRRAGSTIYDQIGFSDMTTETEYLEHGIFRLQGFLTEFIVEMPENLVKIPMMFKEFAVLLEPMSIALKGMEQTLEIQRRFKVWRPKQAAVIGCGTIGLLMTLILRLQGLDVTSFDIYPEPNIRSSLVNEIGANYLCSKAISPLEASAKLGGYDMIFEASGDSEIIFESISALAKNGILCLFSLTSDDKKIEIGTSKLNLDIVTGNKVVFGAINSNRWHFEAGLREFAKAETIWTGWMKKLLTHPVVGLSNISDLSKLLDNSIDRIKTYVIVNDE